MIITEIQRTEIIWLGNQQSQAKPSHYCEMIPNTRTSDPTGALHVIALHKSTQFLLFHPARHSHSGSLTTSIKVTQPNSRNLM